MVTLVNEKQSTLNMRSIYYLTEERNIRTVLHDEPFLMVGSSVWFASQVTIGQTAFLTVVWVYNHKLNEVKNIGGRRYIFINKGFETREDHMKEFLVVDQLNNISYLDTTTEYAIKKVRFYLKQNVLDREKLFQASKQFATDASQLIINRILLDN